MIEIDAIRERINEEARKSDSELANQRRNPPDAWPYG
jgi:hypothetical protein